MIIIKKSILLYIYIIQLDAIAVNTPQFLIIKKQNIISELQKPNYIHNKNTLLILDSRTLVALKEHSPKDIEILLKLYTLNSILILYFNPFIKKRKVFYKGSSDKLKTKDKLYKNNNKNNNISSNLDATLKHQENIKNNNPIEHSNNDSKTVSPILNDEKITNNNITNNVINNNEEEHLKLLNIMGIKKSNSVKYIMPINKSTKNNPYIMDNIVYNYFIREEILFDLIIKLKQKNKDIKHIIYVTQDKKAEMIIKLCNNIPLTVIYMDTK